MYLFNMPEQLTIVEIQANQELQNSPKASEDVESNPKYITEKNQENNSTMSNSEQKDSSIEEEEPEEEDQIQQYYTDKDEDDETKRAKQVRSSLFQFQKPWQELKNEEKYPDYLLQKVIAANRNDNKNYSLRYMLNFNHIVSFVISELQRRKYQRYRDKIDYLKKERIRIDQEGKAEAERIKQTIIRQKKIAKQKESSKKKIQKKEQNKLKKTPSNESEKSYDQLTMVSEEQEIPLINNKDFKNETESKNTSYPLSFFKKVRKLIF